jgi:hypothetical protein
MLFATLAALALAAAPAGATQTSDQLQGPSSVAEPGRTASGAERMQLDENRATAPRVSGAAAANAAACAQQKEACEKSCSGLGDAQFDCDWHCKNVELGCERPFSP